MNYSAEQKKYKFIFGKYEGLTIGDLLDKNPGYLEWCEENIKGFLDRSKMLNRGTPQKQIKKETKKTEVSEEEVKKVSGNEWARSLKPNLDFFNQKE